MEFVYIQQILSGDVGQFSWFVNKYGDMAFTIAYRITNQAEDAEEVVQDAFMKAYRSLNSFRQDSKFSTWLYKIVVNTALSKTRKKQLLKDEWEAETEEIPANHIEDAYKKLARVDQQKIIHRALGSLNMEDRLLLTLHYLQELSHDEIEEITGISKDNLKMKLHRARKKMYTILANQVNTGIQFSI
jgi:RNA polymerase sigma factor (sigma-70 family)